MFFLTCDPLADASANEADRRKEERSASSLSHVGSFFFVAFSCLRDLSTCARSSFLFLLNSGFSSEDSHSHEFPASAVIVEKPAKKLDMNANRVTGDTFLIDKANKEQSQDTREEIERTFFALPVNAIV